MQLLLLSVIFVDLGYLALLKILCECQLFGVGSKHLLQRGLHHCVCFTKLHYVTVLPSTNLSPSVSMELAEFHL